VSGDDVHLVGLSGFERDKTGFAKAAMGLGSIGRRATDDNMVEDLDSENATGFNDLPCNAEILCTGGRIATWVIVGDNDGGGGVQDGTAEHFSRVNKRRIEQTQRDKPAVNDVVSGVQIEDNEGFLS
jgi:hypothetical protein